MMGTLKYGNTSFLLDINNGDDEAADTLMGYMRRDGVLSMFSEVKGHTSNVPTSSCC